MSAGVAPAPSRSNAWAAVHRTDAAQLVRLGLEQAAAGARLHAVAEGRDLLGIDVELQVADADCFGGLASSLELGVRLTVVQNSV